ncbi:MAG TPA: HAMP domain-containing sensor histidine kinase [Flavobacteriales bacterium]|nr:HAMP domain-containing sensor histidine kinase [Flavobacteriales bacterium]
MKATPDQAERLHRFAHDLRNRLAAMHQAAAQLANGESAESGELLAFAEQQFFKAMRATEDLMDDLGVERGVGELKRERIDLKALVQHEIDQLAHRFERKKQPVAADLADDAIVSADPHWIKLLVTALLSNASKFSPANAPIQVLLRLIDGDAVLDVRDSGIGVDTDELPKVFTRYAMLRGKPTAGEAQGRSTLARAKQWAQAHGGDLEAKSPGAGQGSTFTLRLPLA